MDLQDLQHSAEAEAAPKPAVKRTPPLAIFIVGLVVGVLLGYVGSTLTRSPAQETPSVAESPPQPAASGAGPTLLDTVVAQTRHFKGDPDAPITLIEFSDFKCPYCGRHANETAPQIEQAYVQSGVVRVGYYSLAFLSPESQFAAEASECAADQEAFWEYHNLLFTRLGNGTSFDKETLKQYAAELKLDTAAFNDCLDTGKYTAAVQQQTAAANSIGVQSTPTFLVNGQPVVGAQPFEVFQQVIESQRGE